MKKSELKQLIREVIEEIAFNTGNLDQQINDLAMEYKDLVDSGDIKFYGEFGPEEFVVKMVNLAKSYNMEYESINKLLLKKLGIGLWKRRK